MHGMSATTGSGCHGMVPMPLAVAMSPIGAPPTGSGVTAAAPAGSVGMGSGELCLSGQPPTPGDWALALLAALALVGCVVSAVSAGRTPVRRIAGCQRWRGPPHLAGMELLTAECVSRT